MKFNETYLSGVYVIEPKSIQDQRGWFMRTFCKDEFYTINHTKEWVQLNHSFTEKKGSIRGLHYQIPPYSEIKLVRCISGTIIDVVADLRLGSPTFLKWFSVELSDQNHKMIYIPEGFAHGFQTLTDGCQLIYHHTAAYVSYGEGGIRFDDPLIQIKWPLPVARISDRDINHPLLNNDFKGFML